jgi:predicted DNA-binding transcriptional regulator AlpA
MKLREFLRYAMLSVVDTEQLLTPEETAALLKISPNTLAYWRRPKIESDLPWVEVGGQVRYRYSDIQAWLDKRTKNGAGA